jgi:hypothetical protein
LRPPRGYRLLASGYWPLAFFFAGRWLTGLVANAGRVRQ